MQHISDTQELTEWIFNVGKWGKSSQEHLPFEPAPVLKMFENKWDGKRDGKL